MTRLGKRPAPATRTYPASPGIDHARTYAAQHGHLTPDKHTHHNGFPLGQWLGQQRHKARAGTLSTTTAAALTHLNPWWNPPWPYTWHRTWQQYRTTISGNEPLPDTLQHWANAQRSQWSTLHPGQRQLLTTASFAEGWDSPDMKP
ncbi:helicase associated domain-containing protein [Streptomyces sp. GC420]|uniref:helicase associated domain-containing protein n=1 Tax=Streptomyces sp. GC420 TaxID=2697568 RepID=UPI0014152E8B|nr:helicase associated domain-containing protein [Streptomyces sp. GC420]NBM21222.1 hypothetical protein [Streptomyces sp. GC420]